MAPPEINNLTWFLSQRISSVETRAAKSLREETSSKCVFFGSKVNFHILILNQVDNKSHHRVSWQNELCRLKSMKRKMFLLKTILLFGILFELTMCGLILGEKSAEKRERQKCKTNEELLKINETKSSLVSVKTGETVSSKQLPKKCKSDDELTFLTVDNITELAIPFICSKIVLQGKENVRCITDQENGKFYCEQIVLRRCFDIRELLYKVAYDSYLLHIGLDNIDTKCSP